MSSSSSIFEERNRPRSRPCWGPWVFRAPKKLNLSWIRSPKIFSCCVLSRFSPSLEICDADPIFSNTWIMRTHSTLDQTFSTATESPLSLCSVVRYPYRSIETTYGPCITKTWDNSSYGTAKSLHYERVPRSDESRAEQSKSLPLVKAFGPPFTPILASRSLSFLAISADTLMDDERLLPNTLFVSGGWLARLDGDGEGSM